MKETMREDEHHDEVGTPDHSVAGSLEKETGGTKNKPQHLETIRTISRVPNPHYYEKNGLRTYGDEEDHEHEPPVSYYRRRMATVYSCICR